MKVKGSNSEEGVMVRCGGRNKSEGGWSEEGVMLKW